MSLAPGTRAVPVRFAAIYLTLLPALGPAAEPGPPPREDRLDRHGYPLPPGAVDRLGVPPPLAGFAWSLAWTADGTQIVAADWNGVTLLDAATGRWLAT